MRLSATARRYAKAAFDVAHEDGDIQGWMEDLSKIEESLEDPSLASYFKDPSISTENKLHTVEQMLPDVRAHVLNLMRVLVTRHRVHLLPSIAAEFARLEREAQGLAEAEVVVARDIGDAEKATIAEHLGNITGKRVEIRTRIDPAILGGVVIRIGDRLIDASVAGRLQRLRQEMAV